MSDKWAVDIVEAMKRNSEPKHNGVQNIVMIGRVVSVSPLKIEINGQTISKHLHINPALLVLADDNADKIQEAFDDALKIKSGLDGTERQPKNGASSTVDKYMDVIFTENPIVNVLWFDFLKEFHQKYVLKKGDEIIVMQSGIAFYILSKVVAV